MLGRHTGKLYSKSCIAVYNIAVYNAVYIASLFFFFLISLQSSSFLLLDLCVSLLLCALDGYVAVVVRYGTCDVPAVS